MKLTSDQVISIVNYFTDSGQPLIFTTDPKGKIRSANTFAISLLGSFIDDKYFSDIIIDFQNSFSFEDYLTTAKEKTLLNLMVPDSSPRSYLFSFLPIADQVVIIGETDGLELESLQKQLLSANKDLSNMTRELHKKNNDLQKALKEIKSLQGIIPICMHCKQIRDDKGFWNRLEAYIESHSEAQFSHSICEKCLDEYYPEDD